MLPRRRPRAPPAAKAAALAAAFAAALALCAARPAAAAPSEGGDLRPNILFILTDDQDTYLGSDQHMPNLAKTMAVRVVRAGRPRRDGVRWRARGWRTRARWDPAHKPYCLLCRGARGARCGGRQEGESRTADSKGPLSAPRAVQAGVASRPVATSSDGVRMRRCGWGRQFS